LQTEVSGFHIFFLFAKKLPGENSGFASGIFCYQNFGSGKSINEVSSEVSVEQKPKKLSKFRAEKNV
jgi:hypothetical protein